MEFLSGDDLTKAIRELKRSNKWHCAVAFWGNEGMSLMHQCPDESKIICNLESRATNPEVIAELIAKLGTSQVRQNERLHAKVYIGDNHAIVTSANASANGLGIKGGGIAYWLEAGVRIEAEQAEHWFTAVFAESRDISPDDIARARKLWKPNDISQRTFGEALADGFDPKNILLNWWQDEEEAISRTEEESSSLVVEIQGSEDQNALVHKPWMLWWRKGNINPIAKRDGLEWYKVDGVKNKRSFMDGAEKIELFISIGRSLGSSMHFRLR
ncbi:MAG: phospholipase D family protein [Hyphomicrobiaceae bacterium]